MHELSLSSAILETVERHAAGRRVSRVTMTVGALRQVVPDSLDFYFEIVSRDTVCDGAELRQTLVDGRARCDDCAHEWELDLPAVPVPGVRGERARRWPGRSSRSSRSRFRGRRCQPCTSTTVRVAEDALDANTTIAHANRARLRPRTACGW